MAEPTTQTLDRLKHEFRELGYVGGLLRENYSFSQILSSQAQVSSIPLAAFAQEPPSYRNACFGVVAANGKSGASLVEEYRSLGAPQVLEIRDEYLLRWKMTSRGTPEVLEQVRLQDIPGLFAQHSQEWAPHRLLGVKTTRDVIPVQLDFFDLGLLPLLDREVRSKLDRLLHNTVTLAINALRTRDALESDTYPKLFRLLFRLLAAKVLGDRGHPGSWLLDDPRLVIASIEDFYFKDKVREAVLDDHDIQSTVWSEIRKGFRFQNLSVEALAYVYENTLVTAEARRRFGIHGTPPEIAEYITAHLPIESLPVEERRIFEPFSGHAVFLVAAMQRLRDLLPPSSSPEERHAYFVGMLSGLELDGFAREVAKLSLMLADYPNPDGWQIHAGDVFNSAILNQELRSANIVLSNPPFEDFTAPERNQYTGLSSVHKPAELLRRVLEASPKMIGMVLPRIFLHGRGYKQIQTELKGKFGSLEVLALPDNVFQHSEADVALLLAYDAGRVTSRIRVSEVYEHDLESFFVTHKPSYEAEVSAGHDSTELVPSEIWLGPLDEVWKATEPLPRLGEIAEIHRGIEYHLPFSQYGGYLVSDQPRAGFHAGVHTVEDSLEPFLITGTVYLNTSNEVRRRNAFQLPWDQPKLIVNARRRTRGHWKITAAPDRHGLVCYQNFHAVWPEDGLSIDVLAAILNGPVANAFVSVRERQRDIRIRTLSDVPIPSIGVEHQQVISSLVREYSETRRRSMDPEQAGEDSMEECRALLIQIDAEVLRAYNLAPRLERAVLDYFRGHMRPGPVEFDQYFPADFMPYLPWYRYISQEMEHATAKSTLGRLPVIRDAGVSEALSQVD